MEHPPDRVAARLGPQAAFPKSLSSVAVPAVCPDTLPICTLGPGPGLAAAAMPGPRTCVRLFLLELAMKKLDELS